jgi:pseudouridylate synthase
MAGFVNAGAECQLRGMCVWRAGFLRIPAGGSLRMGELETLLRLSTEVRQAIAARRPVVALESTVIAHGVPRPRNLTLARELEAEVRAVGAVPATVAVVGGAPIVGASLDELERIATDPGVLKLSTRDLPLAIAAGKDGATTVAATMALASRAGISVFATGGIGGVHRGMPFDVSSDLTELGRTRMLVVSAGAKAILDLAATREALETAGVLVLGWRTSELPAFYSPSSGLAVDQRVETFAELGRIWRVQVGLGLQSALLLCVPPPESAALEAAEVATAVDHALSQAERGGIHGKQVTPYLLRAVSEATGGRSLEANLALLRQNARIAAQAAAALSERRSE